MRLTTDFGIPVPDDRDSQTAGRDGPILLQDHFLTERTAQFVRERIPERIVHAKGAGAYGYFVVTADVSRWTKVAMLSGVGKRTPVMARFSTVIGERGTPDSVRDARGFAVKFYTEEGNYDLVGSNTPVFFIRDPMKFLDLIHAQRRRPDSNLPDPETFWDFMSRSPETLNQIMILFSPFGTPASYRRMYGFSAHAFKWVNSQGGYVWVKYAFIPDEGVANLTQDEVLRLAVEDPDHAARDLWQCIAGGGEAAWRLQVQVLTPEEAESCPFNPFDLTREWLPEAIKPLTIGRLVLNRNPANHFAEIEQAAFSPANMVPGVEPSPDRMLQARLFAYSDAQRYRIGTNYALLPVNAPRVTVSNDNRDGAMRFGSNFGGRPNYAPVGADRPPAASTAADPADQISGTVVRAPVPLRPNDSDYTQPGQLYRRMTVDLCDALIANLAASLKQVSTPIQERMIAQFHTAEPEFGERVARGLGPATPVMAGG